MHLPESRVGKRCTNKPAEGLLGKVQIASKLKSKSVAMAVVPAGGSGPPGDGALKKSSSRSAGSPGRSAGSRGRSAGSPGVGALVRSWLLVGMRAGALKKSSRNPAVTAAVSWEEGIDGGIVTGAVANHDSKSTLTGVAAVVCSGPFVRPDSAVLASCPCVLLTANSGGASLLVVAALGLDGPKNASKSS